MRKRRKAGHSGVENHATLSKQRASLVTERGELEATYGAATATLKSRFERRQGQLLAVPRTLRTAHPQQTVDPLHPPADHRLTRMPCCHFTPGGAYRPGALELSSANPEEDVDVYLAHTAAKDDAAKAKFKLARVNRRLAEVESVLALVTTGLETTPSTDASRPGAELDKTSCRAPAQAAPSPASTPATSQELDKTLPLPSATQSPPSSVNDGLMPKPREAVTSGAGVAPHDEVSATKHRPEGEEAVGQDAPSPPARRVHTVMRPPPAPIDEGFVKESGGESGEGSTQYGLVVKKKVRARPVAPDASAADDLVA